MTDAPSPWAPDATAATQSVPTAPVPPAGGYAPAAVPPGYGPAPDLAPRQPAKRRGVVWWVVALVVVVVVSAGVASATTWALRSSSGDNATTLAPSTASAPPAPTFTADQVAAAKNAVCQTAYNATRGDAGRGGIVDKGQLNVEVMVRAVNAAVAIQNVLSPATPPDVADAARQYIDATLQLTSKAAGNAPIDELTRITVQGNEQIDRLMNLCGITH